MNAQQAKRFAIENQFQRSIAVAQNLAARDFPVMGLADLIWDALDCQFLFILTDKEISGMV
jgi:hypothetical protein